MIKSAYIHIPYCHSICTYCDFTKMYYNNTVSEYLTALQKEIMALYHFEVLDTIYIGGGTPSCLSYGELHQLLDILNVIKRSNKYEYTIECNIESIDEDKIKLFKEYGINRISIGVQTVNPKYITYLGRKHSEKEVISKIEMIKKYITNINVDLMYAFPDETVLELKKDISFFLKLDIPHISTYSLIIEPHTMLYINHVKPIDQDLDYEMYKLIKTTLEKNGYLHYETSNYSKLNYESKHNLTYWNNEEYYGFGLGASGYIGNTRYTNTMSLKQYLNGNYRKDMEELSKNTTIENELILGLRKIEGININHVNQKFSINIRSYDNIRKLIEEGKLIDDGNNIYISKKNTYIANSILIDLIGVKYE